MSWFDSWAAGKTTTHVVTYTSLNKMEEEIAIAIEKGWDVVSIVGMRGKVNVGRTIAALALTGGLAAFFGPSRGRDRYTVTYYREKPKIKSIWDWFRY